MNGAVGFVLGRGEGVVWGRKREGGLGGWVVYKLYEYYYCLFNLRFLFNFQRVLIAKINRSFFFYFLVYSILMFLYTHYQISLSLCPKFFSSFLFSVSCLFLVFVFSFLRPPPPPSFKYYCSHNSPDHHHQSSIMMKRRGISIKKKKRDEIGECLNSQILVWVADITADPLVESSLGQVRVSGGKCPKVTFSIVAVSLTVFVVRSRSRKRKNHAYALLTCKTDNKKDCLVPPRKPDR